MPRNSVSKTCLVVLQSLRNVRVEGIVLAFSERERERDRKREREKQRDRRRERERERERKMSFFLGFFFAVIFVSRLPMGLSQRDLLNRDASLCRAVTVGVTPTSSVGARNDVFFTHSYFRFSMFVPQEFRLILQQTVTNLCALPVAV
mmetsp:Transcript_12537/g.24383  ORF Transcript_12537/g.24383 Transcript_12537/m.24383 type:complete len:148 (-) Transcript_12537:81-524(-)